MNVEETVIFSEHTEQWYTVTVTKSLHSPYQLVYEIRLSLLQQAFKKTSSYRGGGRNLNLSEHAEQGCNVSVTYS